MVSCATVPGCKLKKSDLKLKKGSKAFDHNHAARVEWGMARRRLCLVLTDVFKTEVGKAFLDKQLGGTCDKMAQTASKRCPSEKEAIRCQGQKPRRNGTNMTAKPRCFQKRGLSSLQRSSFKKRLHNVDNGETNKDVEEAVLVTANGEDYGVVDCGLSVCWKPAEDPGDADEFSSTRIKDIGTQEKHCLNRKRRVGRPSKCNGTSSPKRQRESVLRLTGEGGRGGLAPVSLIEPGEDCDADSNLVQFSLGVVDRAVASINTESADINEVPCCSRVPAQDNSAISGEPIVLSSDDEESSNVIRRRVRHLRRTLFSAGDADAGHRGQLSSQEIVSKKPDGPDLQNVEVLHMVVGDSGSVSSTPKIDHSYLDVAFTSIFCGRYQGEANGNLMILDQKIIIPLKDSNRQLDVTLTLDCTMLRRYSVWEQEELESRGLRWASVAEPCTILLLCVKQSAAVTVEKELVCLCTQDASPSTTGNPSPFLVLTLKDPLLGMEGALLHSLLELDCLKCLSNGESHAETLDLKDFVSPCLSFDESLELIKSSGRDPLLLRMLCLDTATSTSDLDQHSSCSDVDVDTLKETASEAECSLLLDMSELQTLLDIEQETSPTEEQDSEVDLGMQHSPDEDQENQAEEKMAGTPPYTLCRRRTTGAYTVTMCHPDSTWVAYKHQGVAHRLIQFPPPPLKGGITVTMEDLQCLDSGQYLNDVIIDFYLKYLLQNSLRDVAERSHIFSSFFYKQLTRRDNASEGNVTESCQRQKRHQRVKTWTRHVDIFEKDFLFVPVNQEAHWYLVLICFPGLEESRSEPWAESSHNGTDESPEQEEAEGSGNSNDATTAMLKLTCGDSVDTPSGKETAKSFSHVNCTEKTCRRKLVSKRPCILIMDSLKLSLHERIFKVLREYLQSEWESRRGTTRGFGPDQVKSSHCQVPLQDNSSDCGLYLLQYVESFLKDPVVHFDLPLHLRRWFSRRQVRRKRDEIRELVLQLYRQQMT
ncbi:sentrin-specific protease 7 isoform X2 [Vanacampus margaritifer]